MSDLAWFPILLVALLIVPAVLGLDTRSDEFTMFRSFRDRMRKNGKR